MLEEAEVEMPKHTVIIMSDSPGYTFESCFDSVDVALNPCCDNQEIDVTWQTVPSLDAKPFAFPVTKCTSCGKSVPIGTHKMDRRWAKTLEYFWNSSKEVKV